MELQSFPTKPRPYNRLARFSGYATGISWFLLFTFILSEEILGHAAENPGSAGIVVCIGPLLLLSAAGLLVGVISGHIALAQLRRSGEDGRESALNGIRYGYLGIAYIVLAPLLNLLLDGIGVHLPSIADLL
jgi:hypothetical protein